MEGNSSYFILMLKFSLSLREFMLWNLFRPLPFLGSLTYGIGSFSGAEVFESSALNIFNSYHMFMMSQV